MRISWIICKCNWLNLKDGEINTINCQNRASNDKVTGVLLTDNQGLCYGTRGEAVDKASGIIAAIVDQASKIHPNSNAPVVVLETSDR